MNVLNKIATWFVRKVHVSKLKILISTPIIIASVASVSFDLEYEENVGFQVALNKDEQSLWLVVIFTVFILALIVLDVVYSLKERKDDNSRLDKILLVIQDPNVSEDTKERMMDYLERLR